MIWLQDIQENDLPEIGKKAFELARLKRIGFPVLKTQNIFLQGVLGD
jgi:phosphoenolpyruvate synthase/pyruvate phosphate dikinase